MPFFGEKNFRLPNVATVPQYSPFRYPGGKSRWYGFVKQWVLSRQPHMFVEPFAGGAHAGLAVAIEELAASCEGTALVTYDDSDEVEAHVAQHGLQCEYLNVSTTHHRRKKELLIGKDLTWLCGM